jgi:hypothetical protein
VAGRSRTEALSEEIRGQHLALPVAAYFACTRLVADPLRVYDVQHLNDLLELAASALCKLAPVYVADPEGAPMRRLAQHELEGARLQRGATRLVLRDGRTLSSLSVRRSDLRQAIAVLQAVGIPQLVPSGRSRVK